METVLTALFFTAALILMLAAVLAPCTIAWLTVCRGWPALFPWPVWRLTLLCFVLALPYCVWSGAFDGIWLLAQALFIGSSLAALVLIPLAASWSYWRQRSAR